MFRLRPGPPPPPWPLLDDVYRTEWDWSESLSRVAVAYEIYDLVVFANAIELDYGFGAKWASAEDIVKIRSQIG